VPSKVFVFLAVHTCKNTFCKVLIDVFQSEMMESDVTGILDLDQLDGPVISRLLQVCHARQKERKNFIYLLHATQSFMDTTAF
jgi:hypothetical protein